MIAPGVKLAMLWTFFMFTDKPEPVRVRHAPTFPTHDECAAELAGREVLGAFCLPVPAIVIEWEEKR